MLTPAISINADIHSDAWPIPDGSKSIGAHSFSSFLHLLRLVNPPFSLPQLINTRQSLSLRPSARPVAVVVPAVIHHIVLATNPEHTAHCVVRRLCYTVGSVYCCIKCSRILAQRSMTICRIACPSSIILR